MKHLILLALVLLLSSCEGFKVLTLTNASGANATVTIKPGIEKFNKININQYPNGKIGDSVIFSLPADSSVVLLSSFTSMMFGSRIKTHDLRINYLKIEAKSDTITADSKEKILELMSDPRTRYQSRTDKPLINTRNFGNILIR